MYAAAYLSRSELGERGVDVTLVDRRNYFTFTPLLAEVAVGNLGREHVTTPFRVLARRYGFRFVQDAVCALDTADRVIRTDRTTIPFDYLILAAGAEPQYYGNDRIRRYSLPFTTVDDALAVRGRIIQSLERASLAESSVPRDGLLTIVIAGAGPAGVEIAGGVNTFGNDVLDSYYGRDLRLRVVLVGAGDRILGGFDPDLARDGLVRLRKRGVEVFLNTRIVDAAPGTITMDGPEAPPSIAADTLVWTAGTTPGGWIPEQGLPAWRGGVKVDRFLCVEGHPNILAVGDVTAAVDQRSGEMYPKVAPIAISQGIRAAANVENAILGRPLEAYHAYHAGKIVSLGGGVALVDILGVKITGRLAWWLYRAAYLLKLVGMKNKIRVLVTLALNRVFEPDISFEAEVSSGPGESPRVPVGSVMDAG